MIQRASCEVHQHFNFAESWLSFGGGGFPLIHFSFVCHSSHWPTLSEPWNHSVVCGAYTSAKAKSYWENKRLTISSQTLFNLAIVQAAIFISIICERMRVREIKKKPKKQKHCLLLVFAEKLHLVALCGKWIQVENTWGFNGLSCGVCLCGE